MVSDRFRGVFSAQARPAPRRVFRNAVPDGGGPPGRDGRENALRPTVDLHVTLPAGYQTTINADGRKALMDLLVDLCSQYRLNPAYHTLELLSPEAQPVAFKPNALLGTLDVSCILIKERVVEERVLRKPPPKVPEKTVRLVVNYHQGQKAVVRVRLSEPLRSLLPVICQKCELDPAHVLLLRDRLAAHELDLCQSLAELEIRELYAFDQTLALQTKMASSPSLNHSVETLHSPTGRVSGTEKKGLLGLFKFNRRKSKTEELGSEDMDELDDSVTHSTDTCVNGLSMLGGPCVEVRPNTLGQSQSAMNLSRLSPKMDRKKRRAPPPPHTPVSCPDSQVSVQFAQPDDEPKSLRSPNDLNKGPNPLLINLTPPKWDAGPASLCRSRVLRYREGGVEPPYQERSDRAWPHAAGPPRLRTSARENHRVHCVPSTELQGALTSGLLRVTGGAPGRRNAPNPRPTPPLFPGPTTYGTMLLMRRGTVQVPSVPPTSHLFALWPALDVVLERSVWGPVSRSCVQLGANAETMDAEPTLPKVRSEAAALICTSLSRVLCYNLPLILAQPKLGSPRPASQLKKRKAPAPPAMPSPEPPLTTPAPTVHVPAPRTGCGPAQAPPTSCAPAQDPPASHVPVHEGGSPASGDDTSSELSHSIEDSDLAGSLGRSSSSDDAANDSAASSLYDEPMAELPAQRSASSAPEPERSLPKTESAQNPQPAPRNAAKREPRASPTPKEKEPALELKMEDMEDSRHSAIGTYERDRSALIASLLFHAKSVARFPSAELLEQTRPCAAVAKLQVNKYSKQKRLYERELCLRAPQAYSIAATVRSGTCAPTGVSGFGSWPSGAMPLCAANTPSRGPFPNPTLTDDSAQPLKAQACKALPSKVPSGLLWSRTVPQPQQVGACLRWESQRSRAREAPAAPLTMLPAPAGSGRYVPPKPRRVPLREPGRVARGPTPSSPPPPPGQGQHEAPLDISVETARHSWVHSAEQGVEQEAETASMCSSESFADQGYAASEGLAEDSVPLGSPCELAQPTSPEDTSLGRNPTSTPSRPKDCSSDSDEGCATWGSRHSGDVRREPRPGGTPKGFVDDAEVTAQINLTLADLDAELAVNHSGEAPVCVDDDIPMSFVDMDIPVTTIDEVPGDDRPSVRDEHQRKEDVSNSLKNASVQDKNNNACMSEKASSGHTQADWIQPFSQEVVTRPGIKAQVHHKKVVSHDVSERSQRPVVKTPENVLERRLEPPPFVQSHSMVTSEIDRASSKAPSFTQIKITQNPVSRFGLKTFTVIPPKPTISQTPKPVHSMDQGAIKIDEFGNMVKQRAAPIDKYQNLGEATNNPDSPLVGKAKAFWSSAKKQGPASDTHKGDSVNASEVGVSKTIPVAVVSQPSEKSNEKESLKKVSGPTSNPASTAENKLPMSDPAETATLTRQMKDLSFLKPSRRTSSHYVASAIAKYTGNPSTQVDGIPGLSESTSSKQSSSQGFRQTTNIHTISNHKDTQASANPVPYFAGPKRSLSYSGHVLEKQTTFEHPQTNITGKEMFFGTDGTESLNANPLDNKPRVHTQTSTCSEPTKPSSKEGVSTKITPEKASPVQSLTKTTRPAIPKKPELATQTSMFGPVMKFKPMIQKSMEKESSLHSSLMEAIQSGEGIERLHKVSRSPRTSPLKKPCYVEAENERSALLSAIRAQSNSARLKKRPFVTARHHCPQTRSEAAAELERFRNGEDNRAVQNDTTPPTPPEPPAFAPPPPPAFTPPPPPPLSAPPAPHSVPPSLPIATPKPALVLPPGGNPELAREVLLEAIRSGSGAERLKK
ncbi:hypothetical protein P4O66_009999, partial [Electrophorus voltai]